MLMLIVEDDDRVARFLGRGFREEGWTVDRCARGDDALRQGPALPYDIIVLDWSLPGLDGVEVLRRWRAAGLQTPVLMLTARGGVDATVIGLDAGADDYIEKPFSFEELLARVRARLRRAAPGSAGTVTLGEAEIDLKSRSVSLGGEVRELTPREFELLDLLLRHRGEVLSRSQILDRVWGLSADPTTNVVDVYVRYLRSKIDPHSATTSAIETVRGRGYRLREDEP